MSREKQIEEMALELCRPRNIVKMIHSRTCGNCDTSSCDIYELCVDLYNAGYRKQEWISVDERLPEEYKECLVAAKVGDKMVIDIAERVRSFDMRTNSVYLEWLITNDWNEGQGCEITHWMPLPEVPKMKGGAE